MASELGFLTSRLSVMHGRNPGIGCHEETHVRPSHAFRLGGYTTLRYDHPSGEKANGGTAILVKVCIYSVPVNFRSPLQVIAVRVHLPTPYFVLWDICLSPIVPVRRTDLTNLLLQLPPPYIFLRDFNAKHVLWACNLTNDTGTSVYDVYADFDLILLNTCGNTDPCLG
jgi:hypothetical protein